MNKRGFTLIEAITAVGITVMAVIFVISIFPTTQTALRQVENRAIAAEHGQTLLNSCRAQDFSTLVSRTGSYNHAGIGDGKRFSQRIDYRIYVRNQGADRKAITVTLNWRENTGPKTLVVESLRTRL